MYLRLHKSYEKRAAKELLKMFKKWGSNVELMGSIPGLWDEQLNNQMPMEDIISTYIKIYKFIGITHGKRIGKEINKDIKMFDSLSFESVFERAVIDYIHNNGLRHIMTVRASFIEAIRLLIEERMKERWTTAELTRMIHKKVNSPGFYRWQALRIARTESTGASNYGALIAGDNSGFVTQKMWISASDARTRRKPEDQYDHFTMHGQKVERYEPFKMVSNIGVKDELQYPGDPEGEAGNIINCRCSVAIVLKKDSNGRLIRK